MRSDGGIARPDLVSTIRGARAVAEQAMSFRRFAETATRVLVNGIPGGVAWAPDGSPFSVLALTVNGGRIVAIDVLADPERLRRAGSHDGDRLTFSPAGGHIRAFLRVLWLNHRKKEHADDRSRSKGTASAPRWVTFFAPIAKFLLAARVPLGFNGLITIRGRTSGLPRTTPIAIIDVSGRRWVWSPWGEVNWVRNLRAAGRATITVRGREEEVRATELDPARASRVLPRHPRSGRARHAVRVLVHPRRRRRRSPPSAGSGRWPMRLRAPPARMRSPTRGSVSWTADRSAAAGRGAAAG